MVTQWVFLGLVVILTVQRLAELRLSARNERRILEQGGREMCHGQMVWMRVMHTCWLIAMPLEVFFLGRPFLPLLAVIALIGVLVGQTLRYAAIRTLGDRWTVKVMVLPERPPVTAGIFQRIRHPNYLGVILEIALFPLLHGAWLTAVVFTVLNGLMLRARIRCEEAALDDANDYHHHFGNSARS